VAAHVGERLADCLVQRQVDFGWDRPGNTFYGKAYTQTQVALATLKELGKPLDRGEILVT
jgi:hypothetical protein